MSARAAIFGFMALAGATALSPGDALAQENVVVVELFTSQGCSACPPADALIGELAGREDVIALALHVDYWDYIGWADTFARPAFTDRQEGYSRAAGSTMVYTPQMIVDGTAHVVGSRAMALSDVIVSHAAQRNVVQVTVTRQAGALLLEAEAQSAVERGLDVHLVSYLPQATVDISRGENAGTHAMHYNVVRDWQVVAGWDGQGRFTLDLPGTADLPRVVLFQLQDHGAILGAARLDD